MVQVGWGANIVSSTWKESLRYTWMNAEYSKKYLTV